LNHPIIKKLLNTKSHRNNLINTLSDRVIEVKASSFGDAVENARHDFQNYQRNTLLLQALVDEIYPMLKWGSPPEVKVALKKVDGKVTATYNLDFNKISEALGKDLNFHNGTPLAGIGVCNKLLLSAANLNCDLYLGKPISTLVGDKLYETSFKYTKSRDVIEQLSAEVEFPDIRHLVNTGRLKLKEVMLIRKKGKKFRRWLQEERGRDRNAIIAYHNEVSKEADLTKFGRKSLRLFGLVSGVSTGALIMSNLPDVQGQIVGPVAGAGVQYLTNLLSKIGENWRPVVFGNWLKARIEKTLDKVVDEE